MTDRDHDNRCMGCDRISVVALCHDCSAIDADSARLASTLLAIASSNPATASDSPTRAPGTIEPVTIDSEDPHGLAGDW